MGWDLKHCDAKVLSPWRVMPKKKASGEAEGEPGGGWEGVERGPMVRASKAAVSAGEMVRAEPGETEAERVSPNMRRGEVGRGEGGGGGAIVVIAQSYNHPPGPTTVCYRQDRRGPSEGRITIVRMYCSYTIVRMYYKKP